jgi:hypothetical protein
MVELLKRPLLRLEPIQVVHLHMPSTLPSFEFLFLVNDTWLHLALLVCISLKYCLLKKLVIASCITLVGVRLEILLLDLSNQSVLTSWRANLEFLKRGRAAKAKRILMWLQV